MVKCKRAQSVHEISDENFGEISVHILFWRVGEASEAARELGRAFGLAVGLAIRPLPSQAPSQASRGPTNHAPAPCQGPSQGLANQTLGPNRPPHSLRRVRKCRCRPGALAAPPADRSRSQPPKRRGTCAIALLASQVTKLAGASRNSLSTVLQRQAPSLVAPVSGTPGGQIR